MFVGVGASAYATCSNRPRRTRPASSSSTIDAVGRHRGAGLAAGQPEREQTLNQLLVEMDGFEANEGVILIATNRPDVLEPALLRPPLAARSLCQPDITGREDPKGACAQRSAGSQCRLKVLARGTPGFSGADLMNLVNEAALMAARRNSASSPSGVRAPGTRLRGRRAPPTAMTQAEKELTAYHEAGHAILALNVPAADPLHKATIIPRGRALGMVGALPEGDRYR